MSRELAIIGADTANQQAGGGSFFDNSVMFTGSAVLSGLSSIYNTAVDYGNKFGAEFEQLDVSRVLENYDRDWYSYYQQNKQLVDTAGFVATSFIPGTLAIKGLKAAQAAKATGAIGRAISGPLNFANAKRDAALLAGLEEIGREGGTAYAYINANKLASMAWGFADQTLQAAAFETAVLLTMKQSPLLADKGTMEVLNDAAFGAFIGGAAGGALDAIVTNKVFKDAVKSIAGKQRKYDVPDNLSKLGLGVGDEAFSFVDSILSLPKEILEGDNFVKFKNALNKQDVTLDIGALLKRTLTKTEREGYENLSLSLKKLGSVNSPEVGQAMDAWIMRTIKEGVDSGKSAAEIKMAVGSMTTGLKKVTTITDNTVETFAKDDLFYINHEVDLTKMGTSNTIDDFMKTAFNRQPFDKNATAKPYQIIGDVSQAKVTLTATKFEDAWKDGADMAIIGGKVRINPKSAIFEQITDPLLVPQRFWNARTGGTSDSVVATWADKVPVGQDIRKSITTDGVMHGKKHLNIADDVGTVDPYIATARHAWASTLGDNYFAGRIVEVSDISRLERLAKIPQDRLRELGARVQDLDGGISNAADVDLARLLSDSKLSTMTRMLDDGVVDMREIAYVINAPDEFLERAIANGFTRTAEDTLTEGMSRELETYLLRENFVATWASPRKFVELGITDAETLASTEAAASSKGAKYVDTFVTGDLGFRQRVEALEAGHKNAFHSTFGSDANKFMDIDTRNAAMMADELGVGAGALSFSNANYGETLKLWSQYTGHLVHQLKEKIANVNLEKIQPYIAKLTDNKRAGAELGVITTMLRRSPHKFVLAFDDTTGAVEQLAVREVTKIDKASGMRVIVKDKLDDWLQQHATTGAGGSAEKAIFQVSERDTLEFLKTWKGINGERINKRQVLMNSRGATLGWDPDVIYAPPINTQKYPYFAFVKIKEGHIAGNSDVGMITAKSQEELQKLAQEVDTNKFDVFFKADTDQFYRVKNEYDAGLSMNEPRINSMLQRKGKLSDAFYEVRGSNVLEDYIQYSNAADAALVRHGVEVRYAQLFTELEALGKQYTKVATSQTSGLGKLYDRTAVNPFGDYIRTALDISKRSSFPLISQLNEFVDSVGTTAYRVLIANGERAQKGLISWQEAEQIATKYGIGGWYNAENVTTAFAVANRPADRNLIRETVSKLNMFLATVGLRLDIANSLVNVISLPIMLGTELASLKSLASKDPSALGELHKVFMTSPDGVLQVPSYTKLIGNAITNILGKDGKYYLNKYREAGDVKDIAMQFHDMMGELAFKPGIGVKGWSKFVDSAVEKGAKWTGNTLSEDLTRALSANVMDQLTAPLVAKQMLTLQEAAAYRSVFVNRVNGNYISSQRPILFQGTVGAAVSLFQTYVFNIMQQMTRHIENRDLRALMTMTGLQGAIYGLNGLPFFEAVNTHLIGNANINDGHRDIYSTVTQLAGKELGDWMLYGTASAFPLFSDKAPALYTRGDINPRHVSILPISPLDIPAVEVTRRIVANIWDMGGKIAGGGALGASLLEGLEHNGVSRPLAGFAQLAQGYTSTSKGSLISASNDLDMVTFSTRMLGAKTMDESVIMNAMYRNNAYIAADRDRLDKLGEVVKTKLRKNQVPSDEDMQQFMKQYASAGGNLQNYTKALQRWSRDANTSVVNQLQLFHHTEHSKRLQEIMGGTLLEDYNSNPAPTSQTTE